MKPIKLVISAFGPYSDRVEIDFTILGENGVFLITGDTGSGKTTIFDAISFALFGEASGSRRENSSFRSDFALDNVNTFVELEFIHKNVIYKVERVPRYMRKKKRGEGVTSVGGDATLSYLDVIVTGDKNVTDKCIEILGMNANQFKQIVMIAQGEFLDLLLAKTKDRATIFRHIFDTGIYKDISDNFKNKYLLKKREYEDSLIEIKGYLQSIQLEKELNGNELIEQILEFLNQEILNDIDKEKTLVDDKNVLNAKVSNVVEVISRGKLINDSILNLDVVKKRLSILLEDRDRIVAIEKVIKDNKDIWDKIMPKYMELDKLKSDLADKKVRVDEQNKAYDIVLKKYDKVLVEYKDIDSKIAKIDECNEIIKDMDNKLVLFEEIELLEKELNKLNIQLNYCKLVEKKDLLVKYDRYKLFEKNLSELRNEIGSLKDDFVKANKLYSLHYDMFISSQAGILAMNLKKGEACPVCGSKEHPCLAKLMDDVISKDDLDKEKDDLDDKYQRLEDLRISLLEMEKEFLGIENELLDIDVDVLRNEVSLLQNECLGFEIDVQEIEIEEIKKRVQKLNVIIDEKKRILSDFNSEELTNKINTKRNVILKIEKEIENIRISYNDLLGQKSGLESLLEAYDVDIISISNNIDNLYSEYVDCYCELGYKNEKDYLEIMLEKDVIIDYENEVKKYNAELLELNAYVASLEKIINGQKMVDLEFYEKELKEINDKINEIDLSLKSINSKILNNKKIYNNLVIVSEKGKKLEHEMVVYKDLSDTANGTISGKNKLEFEQYVQANYFDMVLLSANKRFGYMTEDRYQLLRKEESIKVSDKLGLELEVMDNYTGKKRDVKSLSGGESFKASLSLALGMSDIIQEFSGGVVVEAMFIDEGFGSLDDASLDQAMNAIMMLSQDNKVIGIISHVNELKERIDKKIVIKKSSSGSLVELIV